MPDPATQETYTRREGGRPNFLLVVIISGIALMLIFAGAWLVVHRFGSHMLAPTHPHHAPHAMTEPAERGLRSA